MENLTKILLNLLKGTKRVGILGIGSELRSDDRAGLLVLDYLEENKPCVRNGLEYQTFLGATAPENITGQIKKFQPTHLIILDAADLGKAPGTIALFGPEDDLGALSFSTHRMPIKIMADYLKASFECKIIMIGIQPKTLVFGQDVSGQVRAAALEVAKTISEVIASG